MSNLNVESFIQTDSGFVSIKDYVEFINEVQYLEGAIYLSVDYVVLLDLTLWDYIVQLWAYILNGLEKLIESNEFHSGFPDQGIGIVFKLNTTRTLITIEIRAKKLRKVTTDYYIFSKATLDAAEDFFQSIKQITNDLSSILPQLAKIDKIRSKMNFH